MSGDVGNFLEEWRWADPNGQQRLVRTDELRASLASGVIPPNAPVWKQGWKEWQPAYAVPELTTSALSAANGVIPNIPPPPLGVLGAQVEMEREASGPRSARAGDAEPPPPPRYVASPTKISQPPGAPSGTPSVRTPSVRPPPVIAVVPVVDDLPTEVSPALSDADAGELLAKADASSANGAPAASDDTSGDPATVPTAVGIPALPMQRLAAKHPPSVPPRPVGRPAATPKVSSRPPPVPSKNRTLVHFGGADPAPPRTSASMRSGTLVGGMSHSEPIDSAMIEEITGSALLDAPESAGGLPPVAPKSPPVEELSGSALIDASEPRLPPPARIIEEPSESVMLSESIARVATVIPATVVPPVAPGGTLFGFPPAPAPPLAPPVPDTDRTLGHAEVQSADGSGQILHDISALSKWRSKPFIATVAVVGALVGLGVVGMVIKLVRSAQGDSAESSETPPTLATSVAASTASAATPAAAASTASAAPTPVSAVAPQTCALAGTSHTIAPRAVVPSGVEVLTLARGIGLGFVTAPQEGMAVEVDPTSLNAATSVRVHVEDTIRRLVPDEINGKLVGLAETVASTDKLAGRHPVAGATQDDPGIDVGVSEGSLAWSFHGNPEMNSVNKLWSLEGDGPVEALRGVPIVTGGEKGFAFTFRRGSAVYVGAAMSPAGNAKELTPKGPLFRILGLGPQVGAPTLAALGDGVLLAWADRAAPTDGWGVRWVEWTPGSSPHGASAFVPPAGGLGDQAMSPALASLGPGRVLLVWTEGAVSAHAVRAQTLGPGGVKVGEPLTISADGVNAGQGQAAVLPDGRGVVAFLAAKGAGGKTYEVVATPITCPAGK